METYGFAIIASLPLLYGLFRAYRQGEIESPNSLRDWLYDEKADRR